MLLRQVPMDLSPEQGADCLTSLAQDLQEGRREDRDSLRDNLLHTMACKARHQGRLAIPIPWSGRLWCGRCWAGKT